MKMRSYIKDIDDAKSVLDNIVNGAGLVIETAIRDKRIRDIYAVQDWIEGAADAIVYSFELTDEELEELVGYECKLRTEIMEKYNAGARTS